MECEEQANRAYKRFKVRLFLPGHPIPTVHVLIITP